MCVELRAAFEADTDRWDAALRDQDLELGGQHLLDERLGGQLNIATVVYDSDASAELKLYVRVADEGGQLLMSPDSNALCSES